MDDKDDKKQPVTAFELNEMARRLRACADDCEQSASFFDSQSIPQLDKVGVKTVKGRIAQIEAFLRKLHLHKSQREIEIREMAQKYQKSRRQKKDWFDLKIANFS